MSYVAITGGENAIKEAARLNEYLRARGGVGEDPLGLEQIKHQLHALHSKALSEGGLYHPDLAALAIKQTSGDPLETALYLRAFRSTRPRLAETETHDTGTMRVIRRISAAFKDIHGGQCLGSCVDYSTRLFRFELLDESKEAFTEIARRWVNDIDDMDNNEIPDTFPKTLDYLRREGLLPSMGENGAEPFDITREPLKFPLPRSAALSIMARGNTGSLLSIAYSNMRGYGDVHPTVAELRVGYLPVMFPHPVTGELLEAGEALITECEVVAMYEGEENGGSPQFTLGYGTCFGHNETKAIAMAILDRSMEKGARNGASHPSEDQEFVLLHVDGVDSMGFASHYKMPHYVTFQSDMDRLRATRRKKKAL